VKFSKEFKIALLTIVSFTTLYLGFNYLKGQDFFSPFKTYYAVYDNIAGLTVSNPVSIQGFTVGRVSNIRLMQDRNNQILVAIDINQDIVVGKAAQAVLTSDFLGNKAIELEIGDISNPLDDGDTVKGVLDKGLADLLTETAQPVIDNIGITVQKFNSLLDTLAGSGDDFKEVLKNTKNLTYNLNRMVRENRENLKAISTEIVALTQELNDMIKQDIRPTLAKFEGFADSLNNLELAVTLAKTNESLENLNAILLKMQQGEGSLGKLLNDDSLYNNLNKTVMDLDSLLIHMNTYPKHFFAPLGKKKKKVEKDLNKSGGS